MLTLWPCALGNTRKLLLAGKEITLASSHGLNLGGQKEDEWERKGGPQAPSCICGKSLLSADSDRLPHALWYTPGWNRAASAGRNLSACFLRQLWNSGPLPCDKSGLLEAKAWNLASQQGEQFSVPLDSGHYKTQQCPVLLLKSKAKQSKKKKKKFLHTSYYSVCASPTRLPQSRSVTLHWNRLYWWLWSIVLFSSPPSSSSSWCYIMSGCS